MFSIHPLQKPTDSDFPWERYARGEIDLDELCRLVEEHSALSVELAKIHAENVRVQLMSERLATK